MPNALSDVIGLSKYVRICEWVVRRPQVREELAVVLADELDRQVRPDGLAVAMQADHYCMHWCGVGDDQAAMTSFSHAGSLSQQ